MRVFNSVAEITITKPTTVAIGVFDGMHRGHQALLQEAKTIASFSDTDLVVITFNPHPRSVIFGINPPHLASLSYRLELLEKNKVDAVLVLPFDKARSEQSAQDFIEEVLIQKLDTKNVVIGENFRFGYKALGDVKLLNTQGRKFGFDTTVIKKLSSDEVWSSTNARKLIEAGEMAKAAEVLGRLPRVSGEVVHGDHRGRELGYPTANLKADENSCLPQLGIYAGFLTNELTKERYPAAISVGPNSTFNQQYLSLEAYVLDQTELDLYGKRIALEFLKKLRNTEKFDSVEQLLDQMGQDVDETRRLTSEQ
jgi:riboflavin kinase/FMN adenylyltransferase